jgi:hypothetical protein
MALALHDCRTFGGQWLPLVVHRGATLYICLGCGERRLVLP